MYKDTLGSLVRWTLFRCDALFVDQEWKIWQKYTFSKGEMKNNVIVCGMIPQQHK